MVQFYLNVCSSAWDEIRCKVKARLRGYHDVCAGDCVESETECISEGGLTQSIIHYPNGNKHFIGAENAEQPRALNSRAQERAPVMIYVLWFRQGWR